MTDITLALTIFLATVVFLLWRPKGINEAIPPAIGALLLYFFGIVGMADVEYVLGTVSGASITIISTMAMSIVLESMGFFRWVAFNLVAKCDGSGTRLYWSVILLCFFMTVLFNNDGSIVITTPIIIEIVKLLELKPRQQFAYLLSGAIIATASSAPIGVSNLANLIALKIVGVDLVTHTKYMFVPSMMGLSVISLLLYLHFRQDIPQSIPGLSRVCMQLYRKTIGNDYRPPHHKHPSHHGHPPLHGHPSHHGHPPLHEHPPQHQYPPQQAETQVDSGTINWVMFRMYMTIIVLVRVSLFIFSYYGIPIGWAASVGALIIIMLRWFTQGTGIGDVLRKTPWHVFIFAFGMYLVVYGLYNVRFTTTIVDLIKEPVSANLFNSILIIGVLTSIMASLFNNHPSLMLATTIITHMGLELQYVQVTYLAIILGSDIGSLTLPSGTLASLIWMYILRNNGIIVTWKEYISTTIRIIPIGLVVSLLSLYLWVLVLS
ncbi:ArsB/NhaD family transporter [Pelosinus sp. IPA-1]|uniref:ArsB/NhaD family transporter n=1 Tax=Pelosinus sp. IPA-1 TaxID=3029569 RepID=UPI0024361659|nr:ArsB/NhaD family transporter [Pelosinus sp. IPA-1]GMA98195.1 putative arsenical pump membrane protein [Pelosinus sp. IPA-1]